jgi:hypothetical protein
MNLITLDNKLTWWGTEDPVRETFFHMGSAYERLFNAAS